MASKSAISKGSFKERSRISPSSPNGPDKRRMVESDGSSASIRLIPRGGTDSDEEIDVIRTQVAPVTTTREQSVLDLTGSRKRRALDLSTPVVIIPSPTTQIAKRIDSIRLEAQSPVAVQNYSRLPQRTDQRVNVHENTLSPSRVPMASWQTFQMQQQHAHEDRVAEMDTGPSIQGSISPASPHAIPVVGKNIEVNSADELLMEQHLQRSEHASNMKRMISDEEEEEVKKEGRGVPKMARTGTSLSPQHQPPSPAIRVPTIVRPVSPSSSQRKKPYTSHRTSPSPRNTPSPSPEPSRTTTNFTHSFPPPIGTLLPFPLPLTNVTPPTTSVTLPTTSTSPQHQSKTKSFSINDLLAKDTKEDTPTQPPQQQIHPVYFNPALLLLYQQWIAQLAAASSTLKLPFQGEPAEPDSRSSHVSSSNESSSPVTYLHSVDSGLPRSHSPRSGRHRESPSSSSSLSGRYSPRTSPIHSSPIDTSRQNGVGDQEERERESLVVPPSVDTRRNRESENKKRESEGKQNALLQVSEAHLAILPDEDGDTPLHLAIIQENIPLTFYLVRLITGVHMNLDIANNMRQTPLHLAIITQQPMLIHLLVQAGASVNFPDRRGNTSIHLAAQRKNVSVLQILSQAENHPPDYNIRNFAGLTPVHVATREGSIEVLKFLFEMGANKNMADSCSGRTALHYAVESQNFQLCNFLLENGCNVNAVTFSGNTPLHIAAGRRLKEIVALLMAYGANPAIANGEGDFPSDLPASLLMQRAKMNAR